MEQFWFYAKHSKENQTNNRWHFCDFQMVKSHGVKSIYGKCFELNSLSAIFKQKQIPEIPNLLCQVCMRDYFECKKNYYEYMIDFSVNSVLTIRNMFSGDPVSCDRFAQKYKEDEKKWSNSLKSIREEKRKFYALYELSGDPEIVQENVAKGVVVPGACVELLFSDEEKSERFYIQPVYSNGTPMRPLMEIIDIEVIKSNAVLGNRIIKGKLNEKNIIYGMW